MIPDPNSNIFTKSMLQMWHNASQLWHCVTIVTRLEILVLFIYKIIVITFPAFPHPWREGRTRHKVQMKYSDIYSCVSSGNRRLIDEGWRMFLVAAIGSRDIRGMGATEISDHCTPQAPASREYRRYNRTWPRYIQRSHPGNVQLLIHTNLLYWY